MYLAVRLFVVELDGVEDEFEAFADGVQLLGGHVAGFGADGAVRIVAVGGAPCICGRPVAPSWCTPWMHCDERASERRDLQLRSSQIAA